MFVSAQILAWRKNRYHYRMDQHRSNHNVFKKSLDSILTFHEIFFLIGHITAERIQ